MHCLTHQPLARVGVAQQPAVASNEIDGLPINIVGGSTRRLIIVATGRAATATELVLSTRGSLLQRPGTAVDRGGCSRDGGGVAPQEGVAARGGQAIVAAIPHCGRCASLQGKVGLGGWRSGAANQACVCLLLNCCWQPLWGARLLLFVAVKHAQAGAHCF